MKTPHSLNELCQPIAAALERTGLVLLSDQKGNILEANPRFRGLLGLKPEESGGANIWSFAANPPSESLVQETLKQEFLFTSKSGFPFWLELGITEVAPVGGEREKKYLWIGFDITERKMTEQSLADSQL